VRVRVSQAAAANAVADAIAVGLLAALVYRASGEHIRNPWLRAVPAVVTVACPIGQETWDATTDLQWPMFFVAFVVLLWNPRRPVPIAVGAVSVALIALTSPFGLLLVPLVLYEHFQARELEHRRVRPPRLIAVAGDFAAAQHG